MMVNGLLEREVEKMNHLRRSQPLASAFKEAPKDKKNPDAYEKMGIDWIGEG